GAWTPWTRAAIQVGTSDRSIGMRVSVVIPTYDEASSIARVLDEIPAPLVTEVLVVDAGSTDGTREIAAAHGARVIFEPRRGYGRACLTGLAAANDPDTVVFLDGDYSDRPGELGRLIDPIREGRADVVLGSRLAGGLVPGAMPWHAVFGNRLAATLIRWLYGVSLTDLGPFRAVRRDVLRAVDLREMTYGWAVELVTRGAMHGYRVMEVPVSYHPRLGISKISGTLRGSMGAAWCILKGLVQNRLRRARFGLRAFRPGLPPRGRGRQRQSASAARDPPGGLRASRDQRPGGGTDRGRRLLSRRRVGDASAPLRPGAARHSQRARCAARKRAGARTVGRFHRALVRCRRARGPAPAGGRIAHRPFASASHRCVARVVGRPRRGACRVIRGSYA